MDETWIAFQCRISSWQIQRQVTQKPARKKKMRTYSEVQLMWCGVKCIGGRFCPAAMFWKLRGIFFHLYFLSAAGSEYSASQLSAGDMTVCAVLEKTTLKCWGNAANQRLPGQWGDESGEMGTNLPSIDLGVTVHDAAVSSHICASLTDGTLKCWGKNNEGQLGAGHLNDLPASSAVTVDLGTGRFATQVALGVDHTCAVLDDGTVKCWGSNNRGQLGTENQEPIGGLPEQMGDSLAPINLGSGRTARQVVTGGKFTCALLDNDSVKCWGRNSFGQLGLGISDNHFGGAVGEMGDSLPTVSLGVGRTAKQISAGRFHVCAILDDDSAKCWGDNLFGQLGFGDQTDRGGASVAEMTNLPTVDVGAGLTVQSVSCSEGYVTCVLLNDHSINLKRLRPTRPKSQDPGARGEGGHRENLWENYSAGADDVNRCIFHDHPWYPNGIHGSYSDYS
eukprot:s1868_g2.t1